MSDYEEGLNKNELLYELEWKMELFLEVKVGGIFLVLP